MILVQGFLIIDPSIIKEQEQTCCKASICKMKMPEQPVNERGCDMSVCNPFMSCLYGNFFIISDFRQPLLSIDLKENASRIFNEDALTDQPNDFFHPPEFEIVYSN